MGGELKIDDVIKPNKPDYWLQTFTGKQLFFDHPSIEAIDHFTIAVALSRVPRFSGHTIYRYSVAQHSVLVADIISQCLLRPDLMLPALLHDAHECYTGFGDVISPAKAWLRRHTDALDLLEVKCNQAIANYFNMPVRLFDDVNVHKADMIALAIEAKLIMGKQPEPWSVNSTLYDIPENCPDIVDEDKADSEFMDRLTRCWDVTTREPISFPSAN